MQSGGSKIERVAFFGLGTMGVGMVRRLLGAGYDLTVYNRNAERAKALGDEGGTCGGDAAGGGGPGGGGGSADCDAGG